MQSTRNTGSKRETRAGGGWPAIAYTIGKAFEVGPWRLWKRMRSANACKTCAVGMGGQRGGMVNEAGHFPEVCKKSLQAQVADMKGAISPEFFERNDLSRLTTLTPKQAEDAGRLAFPVALAEGASHFKPVSWEQALSLTADALRSCPSNRAAFYASGRSSNEAAFLLHTFARVYGTNNVMNCSYYCHQASGVALKMVLGSPTATIDLDDLGLCDLVMVLGANLASNHPRLMTQLANLRARGGQVIVVNPVRESGMERFHVPSQPMSLIFGTEIASRYVQPLAGGDVAFLVGLLKALQESNLIDYDFLRDHAEGYEKVLSEAASAGWQSLERASGVSLEEMRACAELVGESRACIFAWAMGLTHHRWGVDNVLALANVALATGNVGKRGAGLLPVRGHSNVQGVGSVGVTPSLQQGMKEALERIYDRALPEEPGYDTYAMMEAAAAGELSVLISLGGNLWGSNPDSRWAENALGRVETVVYLSTKLNQGHFHGRGRTTIILPVLARDEEPQPTTQESMFNYVRLSGGGTRNVSGQMRAESDVIADLAGRVLGDEPLSWSRLKDLRAVRELIARCVPGWEEIKSIDQTRKEFTIGGRVFHSPHFPTESGRAVMHQTPIPEPIESDLALITLRSEGQFNTVVYEEHDLYRGIPHRFCILISSADAVKLKLVDGQRVTVRGEAGVMENIEVVIGEIRRGVCAMYYPEANVLIRGNIDPRSRTPSFKSAPVWIDP